MGDLSLLMCKRLHPFNGRLRSLPGSARSWDRHNVLDAGLTLRSSGRRDPNAALCGFICGPVPLNYNVRAQGHDGYAFRFH